MDQGRDYAKELRLAGAVQQDTEVVVYVLGATIQPGVEPAIIGGHTRVEPITYDVVLNRAHARTFNLQRKLQLIAETLPSDTEVAEILQSDDQSELFVPTGTPEQN